jgi:hypothetical protein
MSEEKVDAHTFSRWLTKFMDESVKEASQTVNHASLIRYPKECFGLMQTAKLL